MKKFSLYILLFIIPGIISAQNIFINMKSLEKRADIMYKQLAYSSAIDLYKQALAKNKNKNSASIKNKIGKSYYALRINTEAERWYRESMTGKKSVNKTDSIIFYNILMYNGKYAEAEKWVKSTYSKSSPTTPVNILSLYRDSLCYVLEKSYFNSEFSDYSPVYFLEGILFVSDRKSFSPVKQINLQKDAGMSDVYYVPFKSIRSKPRKIATGLKENMNIGPFTIYDKNRKMIFTSNSQDANANAKKVLQLYSAEYNSTKKEWFNITSLNINNKNNSYGHPSMRKDGKALYFVSDIPGGFGGTDIYVSFFQNNTWSKPQNVGGTINTPGNEMFPYINNTGRLYFSSDHHKGLGGLDIYYLDSGAVSKNPVNMGYPINSKHDDFGIITDEDDSSGYFSSNRNSEQGDDNIYRFKSKTVKVELNILDDLTKKPLTDFQINVTDSEFNTVYSPYNNASQKEKYTYLLKPGHLYSFSLVKEDYQEYKEEIPTFNTKESVITRNISLKRKYSYYANIRVRDSISENIVSNASIVFTNLTYEKTDSAKTDEKGIVNIKLDRDAEYYIFTKNKFTNASIFIEKQPKRKASSVSYYSLLTKPLYKKNIVLQISDSSGTAISDVLVEVKNPVSHENLLLRTDKNGKADFYLINDRYYKILCKGNEYLVEYNQCRKLNQGREIIIKVGEK